MGILKIMIYEMKWIENKKNKRMNENEEVYHKSLLVLFYLSLLIEMNYRRDAFNYNLQVWANIFSTHYSDESKLDKRNDNFFESILKFCFSLLLLSSLLFTLTLQFFSSLIMKNITKAKFWQFLLLIAIFLICLSASSHSSLILPLHHLLHYHFTLISHYYSLSLSFFYPTAKLYIFS